MPNLVVHHEFGRQVFEELPDNIRSVIHRPVYDFTTSGPDVWFCAGYYEKQSAVLTDHCDYMHKNMTGQFFSELLETTASSANRNILFSYLAGFLSHYCLDHMCHPFILYYIGNQRDHVRLELAIDCHYIRHLYNCSPWHFLFTRRILTLNKLPKCICEEVNLIYKNVFGWDGAFVDINKCIIGQKRFYLLIQDPFGIVKTVFNIKSAIEKKEYPIQTYFHKDIPSSTDYMNVNHRQWSNPYDNRITSTDSFEDLFSKAKLKCIKMICECYSYAFADKNIDVFNVFGNSSYYSGLSWNDLRNNNISGYNSIFTAQRHL